MLKAFHKVRQDLRTFERKREELIRRSRDMIKLSKRIIYAVHRNDIKEAGKLINSIKAKAEGMVKIRPHTYDTSIGSVALQEYAEAVCYYEFIRNKRLPSHRELKIDVEPYLMGICDLTGELVRKAVGDAIKRRFNEVFRIKNLVDDIYGEFLKLDLRGGELRKKSDAIKWNLKRLEDLVLDIKRRR